MPKHLDNIGQDESENESDFDDSDLDDDEDFDEYCVCRSKCRSNFDSAGPMIIKILK